MNESELLLIYRTTNAIEAKSLAMHLEDAGIDTRLTGEKRYDAYAGLPLDRSAPIELWISAANRDAATPVVEAWRNEYGERSTQMPLPKVQYSMIHLLAATTLVAVFAWFVALIGDANFVVALALLELLLYVGVVSVYCYRRLFARSRES